MKNFRNSAKIPVNNDLGHLGLPLPWRHMCRYTVTGSHAGRASAAAATVLPVRRADTDTVPEGGYHTARRLPRFDPGRPGGGTGPCERLQRRPRVRHHPVRRTSGPATRPVADIGQVRRRNAGSGPCDLI